MNFSFHLAISPKSCAVDRAERCLFALCNGKQVLRRFNRIRFRIRIYSGIIFYLELFLNLCNLHNFMGSSFAIVGRRWVNMNDVIG